MRWFKQNIAFLSIGYGVFLYVHFLPRFVYLLAWNKYKPGHWEFDRWPKPIYDKP